MVQQRGCLPTVHISPALAGRPIHLLSVQSRDASLGHCTGISALPRLRRGDFGDFGNRIRKEPYAAADLVPGHVAADGAKAWGQRGRTSKGPWPGQL